MSRSQIRRKGEQEWVFVSEVSLVFPHSSVLSRNCFLVADVELRERMASATSLWSGFLGCGQQIWAPGAAKPRPSSNIMIVEAKAKTSQENRTARHTRIRKKVAGTSERPRLSVFRSNKHMYVQVIDDTTMHTLASTSTKQKPLSEEFNLSSGPTIEVAKRMGEVIAKSCLEKGILKVAFDRGGYPYHGRIEALAAAAREQGLQF